MRTIKSFYLLLNLLFFVSKSDSQSAFSCDQTSSPIYTTYYPNTTDSIRFNTNVKGIYLCGPNTVVTDTNTSLPHYNFSRVVFLNSGSKYITKLSVQSGAHFLYVKSTATLQVNENVGYSIIYYEPGATLLYGGSTLTYSCSTLDLPPSTCGVGIFENSFPNVQFEFFPNPASGYLFFVSNENLEGSKIQISNSLGELVLESEFKPKLPISKLSNGIYTLHILYSNGLFGSKKLIISE